MEGFNSDIPGYTGSKHFGQNEVYTLNASGFGAAADDYAERGIDLNEQLLLNKQATYFFRMNSDAMVHAGIQQDDILIVDRSIKAETGKIIVASVNGEMFVRRLKKEFNKTSLLAENSKHGDIVLEEFTDYACWGVVTCVIHIYEPRLKNNKGGGAGKYNYRK